MKKPYPLALLAVPCLLFASTSLQDHDRLNFTEHLIMNGVGYAYGIAAADINRDGRLDITSADAKERSFYWYENIGNGNFRPHFIERDFNRPRLERHAVGDINGDGWPDLVVVANLSGDLYWYENDGSPTDDKLWRRHVITCGGMPHAYDVALIDINGDGRLDVVATGWIGNEVAWFANPGSPQGVWTKHLIDDHLAEARTIRIADFDGDGYPDLLATGKAANLVVWYRNPGPPGTGIWERHIIDDRSFGPFHGMPFDMNGDGKMDVVMAFKNGDSGSVAWYENPGFWSRGHWEKHVVGEISTGGLFEAVASRLDAAGSPVVIASEWADKGGLYLFRCEGDIRGSWQKTILKKNWGRVNQVLVADLDDDGRNDIVAEAEGQGKELIWWKNGPWRPNRPSPVTLAKSTIIQTMRFPKGSSLCFYDSGNLFSVQLSQKATIHGVPAPAGSLIRFLPSGEIDNVRILNPKRFNGILCDHRDLLHFYGNGRLKSCFLLKKQTIRGRTIRKDTDLFLSEDGRPVSSLVHPPLHRGEACPDN